MAELNFGSRRLGTGQPPWAVAEVGANFNGDAARAEAMLRQLAAAGAEAVKFQLYTAEELVADPERVIRWGPEGREREETIGGLFDRLALSRPAFSRLLRLGRELGVTVFATPFSESGLEFLEAEGVAGFKIAASDVNHLPLLRLAARTHKPVILSLGKCTLAEADTAVETLLSGGCADLVLLHCVAQYPAPLEEMNLRVIPVLAELYPECAVGLSDHSPGSVAAVAAVALGACVVEKHVTVSRADEGPDHWFSMEIGEWAGFQQDLRHAHLALGRGRKRILECERGERRTSVRSLALRNAVRAGQILRAEDVKIVRPGSGLAPSLLEAAVGLRVTRDLPANTVLTWECFK